MAANRLPEPLLNGTNRAYSIETLLDRGELSLACDALGQRTLFCWVLPPWQRDEVWSREQKIAFVEGIFCGFGAGYYVVVEPDWGHHGRPLPMAGWLLDGQQRMTAIRDFIEGVFPVFDGIYYADLDRAEQLRRFLRQPFPCKEIEYTADEGKLKELYRRLNFGGTAHTRSDLARLETC